jgi:hypothetical protein
MRILRLLHAKRTLLGLGLMGMLAFAGGCGGDPNETVAPKLAPDPAHQVTRESQKKGRMGVPVQTPKAEETKK